MKIGELAKRQELRHRVFVFTKRKVCFPGLRDKVTGTAPILSKRQIC
jgi:hypothetical protein